jgi:Ni,Fe-hydrogenase III large subunit/Ni,Fe-hydrogenase III component G
MADLRELEQLLRAGGLIDESTRASGELRVTVGLAKLERFADYLRLLHHARPELILAEDSRLETDRFTLRYIFALGSTADLVIASVPLPPNQPAFPSLAGRWYLASRFEREIHDLFGITPSAHPDLRRLPLHQFWPADYHPLLKDAAWPGDFLDDGQPYPFRRVEGEGVYEITVGPVHAGIIEPGHFRFSVEGETIINLESRLYFVHKGVEKLFESASLARGLALAERISGDSSVAHTLAYCHAVEALAGAALPERAAYLRVVLLELERLHNHIGDVGAILTDTGFAVANAHALRLREGLLRRSQRLTGHRLLRGMVVPGGVACDWTEEQRAAIRATTGRVIADFEQIVEIATNNGSVLDRLHGTGSLPLQTAHEMQVVGIAARACGIPEDIRVDRPCAAYRALRPRLVTHPEGDVWARMMVRVDEAREAVRLIDAALARLPAGELAAPLPPLAEGRSAFGLVEGWRGPIWHWIVAGEHDSFRRVKIKDPSFANWPALNYAILDNIVPDFPLINKSFNLSYAGNDL